jgi:hypothetical protein
MDRQPRKTAIKANALTNARPRRVSVCRAGANQTPLNAAKSESVVVEKKELDNMLTSMKAQGFDIAGVAFSGDQWNRSAVDGWMTAGGYTGYSIDGTDGAFTVKSDTIGEDAEGERRTVKTEDGIAITLFKAAVADATGEPAADTPAIDGAASDVQPVAKSADDVVALIARAKSAFVGEERVKSLYTVSEMASLIRSLKWLVSDMTYDVLWDDEAADPAREALIAELKGIGQQLLNAFAALVNIEVADMADAFKSAPEDTMTDIATKTEIGTAPITDTPTETIAPAVGADAAPAADAPKGDEDKDGDKPTTEGDAPADAPAAATDAAKSEDVPAWAQSLVASVGEITKSVGSLTERVDGLTAPAEKSAEPEAVTAVPATKSADAPEQASGSTVEKSDGMKRFEQNRLKSALGL